jgi:hypothetical protein
MANPDDRSDAPGHRPELTALLRAGQMPKAFSPANLPDIDVTPAIEAVRIIAAAAAVPRPQVSKHPAAGRNKPEMPPTTE